MDDVADWTKTLVVAAITAALGVSLLLPESAVATDASAVSGHAAQARAAVRAH